MTEGIDGAHAERNTDEARQGEETTFQVRYILLVSLVLAIVAMAFTAVVFGG